MRLQFTVSDGNSANLCLEADEPAPYDYLNAAPRFPCLLVCDHASNRLPRCLGDLDLGYDARQSHLGWDIGAGSLTRELSRRLNLPAILCNYSRLAVDCNRSLEDPTAFLRYSDGVTIPRNVGMGHAERAWRTNTLYWPYHDALGKRLTALDDEDTTAALFSIHSFTPVLDGIHRPWDAAVLWDADPRIALPLLEGLRGLGDLIVGDNEPYSGSSEADFTIDYHGEAEGRPHGALEIRQDHLATADGIDYWAESLARILEPILESPDLYRPLDRKKE